MEWLGYVIVIIILNDADNYILLAWIPEGNRNGVGPVRAVQTHNGSRTDVTAVQYQGELITSTDSVLPQMIGV